MKSNFFWSVWLLLSILTWTACQDQQTASEPIMVNKQGDILLFGKTTDIQNLQQRLLDTLLHMDTIPDEMGTAYHKEVPKGMRGKVETTVAEAITKAKAQKKMAGVAMISFQKEKGDDCEKIDAERKDCATIDFQYPSITKGSAGLKSRVKKWVNDYLIGVLTGGAPAEDVSVASKEEAAEVFFQAYEENKAFNPGMPFTASGESEVLLNDGTYLTLSMNGYDYQGGAHGNHTAALSTFDAASGKLLSWEDLVTDQAALQTLAEQQFRAERSDVFDQGFDFDETFPFALPANYGWISEGLYLMYVPYEVGPYAMGGTDFVIPFSKLGTLVKQKPASSY